MLVSDALDQIYCQQDLREGRPFRSRTWPLLSQEFEVYAIAPLPEILIYSQTDHRIYKSSPSNMDISKNSQSKSSAPKPASKLPAPTQPPKHPPPLPPLPPELVALSTNPITGAYLHHHPSLLSSYSFHSTANSPPSSLPLAPVAPFSFSPLSTPNPNPLPPLTITTTSTTLAPGTAPGSTYTLPSNPYRKLRLAINPYLALVSALEVVFHPSNATKRPVDERHREMRVLLEKCWQGMNWRLEPPGEGGVDERLTFE
ncbi:hypothetical protein DL93DRAFT_2080764 [Clavulina sp. PMI_390]|nr:hypothetical protein DL93DRAFT_2080764 [Clavulina sp. PMI_390]